MTRRSLQASTEGINKAQAALIRNSLTQQALAGELGISRQPVTKFFKGKPVDRYIFVTICEKLNLNWEEIVTLSSFPDIETEASISETENLVETAREKFHDSIHRHCNLLRVLSMEQPVSLDDIYVDVNIWERITSRRRLDIEKLSGGLAPSPTSFPGLAVVERYDKLLIWGKPGAGKTTFLKWLVILCNLGEWQSDRLPIFINIKEFAETKGQPSLLEYIARQFAESGIIPSQTAETLLNRGKAMVLLDGLDAVKDSDIDRVLSEIQQFTRRFYTSFFIITCRIAAQTYIFEQFTEVEIADFNYQQITEFASKWFQVRELCKTEQFLKNLQANPLLAELANNPLMLTFLCLLFEEKDDFPTDLSQICQEAIDIWLQQWDAQRHIQREKFEPKLHRWQIIDLLHQIAKITFEHNQRFFPQNFIEQQIKEYVNGNNESEILNFFITQNGLIVEQARGIYSFSHLAFQQYLASL